MPPPVAVSETTNDPTTPEPPVERADLVEPDAFLGEVLDVVERNAYYADRVDWEQWKADAALFASDASSTTSTYPFVRDLIAALDDDHSRFFTAAEMQRMSEPSTEPLTGPAPFGEVDDNGIGYITIPSFTSIETQSIQVTEYVEAAYAVLDQPACGWIVDIASNQGGNLFPMLTALAPILGPGEALGYTSRDGNVTTFDVTDSGSIIARNTAPGAPNDVEIITAPTTFPGFTYEDSPVAVLQGPRTASSGEGALIALRGRTATSFGQPTAGVPTGNEFERLSDGSAINLTTAVGTEPNGTQYDTKIPADIEVLTSRLSRERATTWLQDDPNC